MYYIARLDSEGTAEIGVLALRNFAPEEGVEYYVRKGGARNHLHLFTVLRDVPVYVGVNGKLKKTNRTATGWVFYG